MIAMSYQRNDLPIQPLAGGSVLPAAASEALAEPAQYRIPPAYRRPLGQVVDDKRGKGYYPAVMALSSAIAAIIVALMGGILAITAIIPASSSLALGVRALRLQKQYPATPFTGQAKGMAWGALVLGLVSLGLALAMFLFNSWLLNSAESMNCEYLHAGDDEAIERCIGENTH